jgi:hypothetical protein
LSGSPTKNIRSLDILLVVPDDAIALRVDITEQALDVGLFGVIRAHVQDFRHVTISPRGDHCPQAFG